MLIMQSVQFCIGCIVSVVNETDVVTEVVGVSVVGGWLVKSV